MINKNDDKILQLKEKVESKRKEIGKPLRYKPETNQVLDFDNFKYNFNIMKEQDVMVLLTKLHSFKKSFIELGFNLDQAMFSGYELTLWIADLNSKLKVMLQKVELNKLKQMEAVLSQKLSNDKKLELELQELENSLK